PARQETCPCAGFGHGRLLSRKAFRGAAAGYTEGALPRGNKEELRGVRRAGGRRISAQYDALSGGAERSARRRQENLLAIDKWLTPLESGAARCRARPN